jgi:hypothetical protein
MRLRSTWQLTMQLVTGLYCAVAGSMTWEGVCH